MNGSIDSLIANLGMSYYDLVKQGLIEKHSLRESEYENTDTLEIESISGLELVFSPLTYRFETIYIRLRDNSDSNLPIFIDSLPEPLCFIEFKEDARRHLGEPISSSEAQEVLGYPERDTYQLPPSLHPEALLYIHYGKDSGLDTMVISTFHTYTSE